MAATLAPIGTTPSVTLPQAAPAAAASRKPAPATVSALSQGDRVETSLRSKDLKAHFAPAIALIEQAGYGAIAARLRKAHFRVTDGKSFGVEYYAAAMPGGFVSIDEKALKSLTTKEWASTLLHEGVHLGQNPLKKVVWGWQSMLTKKPDQAEKEAYLLQWGAMKKLGLTGGEIYWTVKDALRQMGVTVKDIEA